MASESERFDAIVVGVGGMGSAAAYHLARRGKRVLGLEQYEIAHQLGSSHGLSRIIRLAYFEHPSYVPLLRRAYELWQELERETGAQLLTPNGSVDAGPEDSQEVQGSKLSCDLHGLPYELLTSRALTERFPGFRLPAEHWAVFQPQGGFLDPERCVAVHAAAAVGHGATVRSSETVLEWQPTSDGVEVVTNQGRYWADRLILSVGSWAAKMLPRLKPLAVPERLVVAWFQPNQPGMFGPAHFPVFNLLVDEGRFYGFPMYGTPGFKIGRWHHREERVDPDLIDRVVSDRDLAMVTGAVERYFPGAVGPLLMSQVCMCTNSPDDHFIVDTLPEMPQVIVAAGFSGHGFKFCSVMGEILADLAERGETRHDIGLFKLGRFAA